RDQLIAAVAKKRAAQARAHEIVIRLIEPGVTEAEFLSMLGHIDPPSYTDIVDEREINKLCGYPLCSNALENVPKQKYTISSAKNKVYDLTQRKKYCSGHCYKASEFVKAQIPASPIWLRDREVPPDFKLFSKNQ
ncbi:hypothetical protein KR018_005966, partial [Drosophila ironensis]